MLSLRLSFWIATTRYKLSELLCAGQMGDAGEDLVGHEGHVADVHFTVSYRQPKLIAIDKQPDDNIMHLSRAGKTDRLAHQAFDPGAQRQMFPLDLLRIALARLVLIGIEMTRVRAPIVRIIPRDAKRF